jgi:hypothetical protein
MKREPGCCGDEPAKSFRVTAEDEPIHTYVPLGPTPLERLIANGKEVEKTDKGVMEYIDRKFCRPNLEEPCKGKEVHGEFIDEAVELSEARFNEFLEIAMQYKSKTLPFFILDTSKLPPVHEFKLEPGAIVSHGFGFSEEKDLDMKKFGAVPAEFEGNVHFHGSDCNCSYEEDLNEGDEVEVDEKWLKTLEVVAQARKVLSLVEDMRKGGRLRGTKFDQELDVLQGAIDEMDYCE